MVLSKVSSGYGQQQEKSANPSKYPCSPGSRDPGTLSCGKQHFEQSSTLKKNKGEKKASLPLKQGFS